jgi:superfamily II DNA/RNA helicase
MDVNCFKPQVVICIENQGLIDQVYDEILQMIPKTEKDPYHKLKVRKMYKDQRMTDWVDENKNMGRCDILVSTPHLLNSLSERVDQTNCMISFSNVKLFVLDEAESIWGNDKDKLK